MHWIIFFIINLAVFILYGIDKYKAVHHRWRIPEKVLLGIAICGGSVGAFLGMYLFRHKTKKTRFQILVPAALIVHLILIIMLYGKPVGA